MVQNRAILGAGHVDLEVREHRAEQRKRNEHWPVVPDEFLHLMGSKRVASVAMADNNGVGYLRVQQFLPRLVRAVRACPQTGRFSQARIGLPRNFVAGGDGGFGQPQAFDIGAKDGKFHADEG
jgi:hypothetical protein